MSASEDIRSEQFAWETQPAAARWVQRAIDRFVSAAADRSIGCASVLREQTGTRLVDWVDHFWLGSEETSALCGELADVGYVADGERWANGVAASAGHVSARVLTGGGDDGIGIARRVGRRRRWSALPDSDWIGSRPGGEA